MTRKILFILLALNFQMLCAQDIKINRQYLTAPGLINPAFTGQYLCIDANLISTHQWLGIPNAPRTHMLDFQTGVNKNKFQPFSRYGLGATLYYDVNGPYLYTGFRAAYAFHTYLNQRKETRLSLGLSATGTWFSLNQSGLYHNALVIPDDPALNYSGNQSIVPNVAAGIAINAKKVYAGISAMGLLPFNPDYERNPTGKRSYYFLTGYHTFFPSSSLYIEPLILFSLANNGLKNIDVTFKTEFNESFGIALSYRHSMNNIPGVGTGLAARISLKHKRWVYAYMYDFGFNQLQFSSYGNHELALGYRFCYKQKNSCPAY